MGVDRDLALALELAPVTVDIERGRLRFFAQSIGETDPVYTDLDAARAAGHRDLPVPPTFFFSLGLERPDPMGYLIDLGVDLLHILHGEQSFDYHAMAYAGDTLTLRERIADVVPKRGGAMDLITKETEVHRGSEHVATCRAVIVALHQVAEATA